MSSLLLNRHDDDDDDDDECVCISMGCVCWGFYVNSEIEKEKGQSTRN